MLTSALAELLQLFQVFNNNLIDDVGMGYAFNSFERFMFELVVKLHKTLIVELLDFTINIFVTSMLHLNEVFISLYCTFFQSSLYSYHG